MLRQYNSLNNEIGELNRSVEKYMEIYKNPKKDYPLFVYSFRFFNTIKHLNENSDPIKEIYN